MKNNDIQKLNRKYISKKFLEQKDFGNINPNVISYIKENNDLIYKNIKNKNELIGTVIESGFYDWKFNTISKSLFKNSLKKFPYSKINKLSNKNKIISVKDKSNVFFRLSNNKSFICFAGAGSGKTAGIVLPTIYANAVSGAKANMIITDPKGELVKSTYETLIKNGYKVRVLNVLDKDNTDCFSPFTIVKEMIWKLMVFPIDSINLSDELIEDKKGLLNEIDTELKDIIFSLDESIESTISDFWNKKALVAIHNIAWLIIDDLSLQFKNEFNEQQSIFREKIENDKDNEDNFKLEFNSLMKKTFNETFIKFSFQTIYTTLSEFGPEGTNYYINFYKEKFNVNLKEDNLQHFKIDHPGISQWNNLWRPSDSKSSLTMDIISNALLLLEKFNSPLLKNMIIYNTFSLDDLTGEDENKHPLALFVTINNSKPATLSYVTWFINYVLMKMNSFATEGSRTKLKKPLLCIFEEIGNINTIKYLPVTVNEGRGKNIFVSLFFQSMEQYEQKYGKSGGGFVRSCAYKLLLSNSESSHFSNELVKYAGSYQLWNEKMNSYENKSRISQQDIYSLPKNKALIFQNDINVPYISSLIPWYLFGFRQLDQLDIQITDPSYNSKLKYITYNPLHLNSSNYSIEKLNHEELIDRNIDYDFWKLVFKNKTNTNDFFKSLNLNIDLISFSQQENKKMKDLCAVLIFLENNSDVVEYTGKNINEWLINIEKMEIENVIKKNIYKLLETIKVKELYFNYKKEELGYSSLKEILNNINLINELAKIKNFENNENLNFWKISNQNLFNSLKEKDLYFIFKIHVNSLKSFSKKTKENLISFLNINDNINKLAKYINLDINILNIIKNIDKIK